MRQRPVSIRTSPYFALALAAIAGTCASTRASVFTFSPSCPNQSWSVVCGTFNGCGAGNTLNQNNWGFQACNATPAFPGAGDDVVFPVAANLDVGGPVRTVTINGGVGVTLAANINTSQGFLNNGTLQGMGGSQFWSGSISNAGIWNEDGAGWTREWVNASFANAGAFQFPGSVSLNHNGGSNSLSNLAGGAVAKTSTGTASINSIPTTNAGAFISNAGGALNLNSLTFTSNPGATYNASGGGAINFGLCTIRGVFPMTIAPGSQISFTNFTCGAPVTLNATSDAVVLSGTMAATPANPFVNNGGVVSAAGNQVRSGPFTNAGAGTWTENGAGWNVNLSSHSFTNAGTLTFPGSLTWEHSAGSNVFVNTGTVVKSGGGAMSMNNFPRTNQGAMNVPANGGSLQFNGSSFDSSGSASYAVTGPGAAILWNGTSVTGTFPFTISAGGSASFTSPVTTGPTTIAATGAAAVINSGTMNTNGGLLTNTGLLAIGAGNHVWAGPWVNSASGVVTDDPSGWTRSLSSSTPTNNGTFNFPGSVNWTHSAGTSGVVNNGTMNKTGGGQFTCSSVGSFINNGTIAVAASGGNFQLSGTAYSGTGTATVGSGGGFQLNNVTVSGTINGSSSGGAFQSTGNLAVPASTTAQLNVTGSGFTVNSNLSVNAAGGLLRNNAIANVAGGNLTFAGSVTNAVGATWTEEGSGWTRNLSGHTFTNAGTLVLPGSVNWTQSAGTNAFVNSGGISKTSGGTFNVNAPTTNNGVISVASGGGTFQVSATTYSGSGSISVAPGGLMRLNSATVTGPINGTAFGSGSFDSVGALTTAGSGADLNVTGNGFVLNGDKAGAPTLRNSAIVTVGGGNKTFSGPITNGAGATWTEEGSGWSRSMGSNVFTNDGTLNLPGSVNWNQAAGINSLTNSATGVVNKISGGAFSINYGVTNAGLIDIQSGSFNVNGGLTQTTAGARTLVRSGAALGGAALSLGGGRLEGRGTVQQAVTNTGGTIAPGDPASSTGTLQFSGTLTMGSGGTMEVNLNTLASSPITDKVVSTGNLTLGGTLRVVVDDPFYPVLSDVYEIARTTGGTRTGVFSSVVVVGPPEVTVSVSYTSNSALLTITGTTCDFIDYNRDGLFPDTTDIDDFLSVFSGGPCSTGTCGDVDFNNDGLFPDTSDIDSLLSVFSGGACI